MICEGVIRSVGNDTHNVQAMVNDMHDSQNPARRAFAAGCLSGAANVSESSPVFMR